ncbi:hypothetical protein TIFTF001_005906 [Ficus carica]|uniref:Uncharacterized protein n=1 Tax=Ficus carica TaxID=3494 RepID=A0AA88CZZ6_FICCA|nr:hypothetical protein TIFTF001_005906 [Ficus carica]
MKLLLLLASLLIITIPNAHSRILQGIMNSGGNKFDMIIGIYGRQLRNPPPSPASSPGIFYSAGGDKFDMISSVYGRQGPSPPPPPSQSPSKRQSARAINSSPNCDDHDITIRSPPSPTNFAAREESDMIISSVGGREGPTLPPPAPRKSPGIVTLGMRRSTPPALCMPGRPCTGGRPPMIAMSAEGSLCK